MKAIFVLALCIAAVSAGQSEDLWRTKNRLPPAFENDPELLKRQLEISPKIIGGSEIDIQYHPHQLSLRSYGSHICGASIISSNWVLTAAHCVYPRPAASAISFRAGSSDRLNGGYVHNAAEIILHQNYNPNTMDFDVSVIRVTSPFQGLNIRPINLVNVGVDFPAGTRSIVTGWGINNSGNLPQRLYGVNIPVVSQAQCSNQWGAGRISGNMVCAGENGRDSCNGDSGGPLITTDGRQFGIVSWGATNCGGQLPGVYTRIASSPIRNFIQQHARV